MYMHKATTRCYSRWQLFIYYLCGCIFFLIVTNYKRIVNYKRVQTCYINYMVFNLTLYCDLCDILRTLSRDILQCCLL